MMRVSARAALMFLILSIGALQLHADALMFTIRVQEAQIDHGDSDGTETEGLSLDERLRQLLTDATISACRALYLFPIVDGRQDPSHDVDSDIVLTPVVESVSREFDSGKGREIITADIRWDIDGIPGSDTVHIRVMGMDTRRDLALQMVVDQYRMQIGYVLDSLIDSPSIIQISSTFNDYLTTTVASDSGISVGDEFHIVDVESEEVGLLTVSRVGEVLTEEDPAGAAVGDTAVPTGRSVEFMVNYAGVPLRPGIRLQPLDGKRGISLSVGEIQTVSSSGVSFRMVFRRPNMGLQYAAGLNVSYCWDVVPVSLSWIKEAAGVSVELTQGFSARIEPGIRYNESHPVTGSRIWMDVGADLGAGFWIDPSDVRSGWFYGGEYHVGLGWYVDSLHEVGIEAGYACRYLFGSSTTALWSTPFVSPHVTFRL